MDRHSKSNSDPLGTPESSNTPKRKTYGSIPNGTVDTGASFWVLGSPEPNRIDTLASIRNNNNNNNDRRSVAKKVCLAAVTMAMMVVTGARWFLGDRNRSAPDLSVKSLTSADDSEEDFLPLDRRVLLDEDLDGIPLFYADQRVDHFRDDSGTYPQRYYKRSVHFSGPGHPILVVLGGESALEPPMLYPFVHESLAKTLGAFVVSPEHRFYGASQPTKSRNVKDLAPLLTPDQALEDTVQLLRRVRAELGCHPSKAHPDYCPVISFGGSYPGFLSAMLRHLYPSVVDGAYASSTPVELYSQAVDADAYFDKIASVASTVSAGCPRAVRSTLEAVRTEILQILHSEAFPSVLEAAQAVGFCPSTFPSYVQDLDEFVSETIQYLVPAIFADFNMGYYPPGPEKDFARACKIFEDPERTPMEKMRLFFALRKDSGLRKGSGNDDEREESCYDVSLDLPDGPNARIRGPDSSGNDGGDGGLIWDFQCCQDLVVKAGYSPAGMFLPRPFSYAWHRDYCERRFPGIAIDPHRLNREWDLANLPTEASRIVFANGFHDGWFAASLTNATALSNHDNDLVVLNFPNGAHHSELGGAYPNPRDTRDILEGYQSATDILSQWLEEISDEQHQQSPGER